MTIHLALKTKILIAVLVILAVGATAGYLIFFKAVPYAKKKHAVSVAKALEEQESIKVQLDNLDEYYAQLESNIMPNPPVPTGTSYNEYKKSFFDCYQYIGNRIQHMNNFLSAASAVQNPDDELKAQVVNVAKELELYNERWTEMGTPFTCRWHEGWKSEYQSNQESCPDCGGDGTNWIFVKCKTCNGTGTITRSNYRSVPKACPYCGGYGDSRGIISPNQLLQ